MFLTVHTAAAAVVSQQVQSPWLVFLWSFLSHFVLDFIPHGDEKLIDKTRPRFEQARRLITVAAVEFTIITFFSIYYLLMSAPTHYWNYFIALFGAILPDMISAFAFIVNGHFEKNYKWLARFQRVHTGIHRFFELKLGFLIPLKYGLVWQLLVFTALVTLLKI